jgi:hypothetical protein
MIFCIHALPSLRDRLERISPIGISFKDKWYFVGQTFVYKT